MRSEWKEVSLGSICEKVLTGGTPKSKVAEYYDGGTVPWLKTKEVNYNRIYSTETCITADGLNNSAAKIVPPNSVIMAMYGQGDTAGRVAINKIELATNQACCNLVIAPSIADFQYVYYYLKLNYRELVSLKSGSAQPNLNTQIIKDYPMIMPPLPKQRAIAATLSCLDDKIELNNKINANLEAQAQAMFKSWFVDFEPFRDGEFVDSELGSIPKGWRVGRVSDIAELNTVSYSPKQNWEYINYLDTSSITENNIDGYQLLNSSTDKVPSRAKRILKNGDIVYSTVRPNQKHFGLIYNPPQNALASTGFAVIRSCSNLVCTEHIYLALTGYEAIEKLQQIAETSTSTFPACKPNDIGDMPIIIPDEITGSAFTDYVKSVFKCISAKNVQSHTLATLRDTLLPKLMSGEIEVPISK